MGIVSMFGPSRRIVVEALSRPVASPPAAPRAPLAPTPPQPKAEPAHRP